MHRPSLVAGLVTALMTLATCSSGRAARPLHGCSGLADHKRKMNNIYQLVTWNIPVVPTLRYEGEEGADWRRRRGFLEFYTR